jgi:hypothetical protein
LRAIADALKALIEVCTAFVRVAVRPGRSSTGT